MNAQPLEKLTSYSLNVECSQAHLRPGRLQAFPAFARLLESTAELGEFWEPKKACACDEQMSLACQDITIPCCGTEILKCKFEMILEFG